MTENSRKVQRAERQTPEASAGGVVWAAHLASPPLFLLHRIPAAARAALVERKVDPLAYGFATLALLSLAVELGLTRAVPRLAFDERLVRAAEAATCERATWLPLRAAMEPAGE